MVTAALSTKAANELAIKVKTMRGTLSPDAAAILDEVLALAADSNATKSSGGQTFLHFTFKLVAVKTIS